MMLMRSSLRYFSTQAIVDKLFHIFQARPLHDGQIKLVHFIKTYFAQGETVSPNLLNDIVHRWAIEHPTKEALWTCETNTDKCQKLTFNDLYKQSARLANVLTGKGFDLKPGKTVLVILPLTQERICLQLACSRSGLVFCPYDPKDMTNFRILQSIQKLAVDCIITDTNHFEIVREYTHNPLRPLKKGLITKCSSSEPLPVGWNHLIQSANDAESEFTNRINAHPNTPVLRLLSNNNQVLQYSQKDFNLQLIIAALWLNINQTSRLIWMKNQNEIISLAPWIFGSSIFYKETENPKTMLTTFENHPIDSFCASSTNYQILENQQQKNQTQLKQLFSTESIDPTINIHWHSLTNLHIRDDYADFTNQSVLKSFSNDVIPEVQDDEDQFDLAPSIFLKPIPLEKFVYQYPVNQNEVWREHSRV